MISHLKKFSGVLQPVLPFSVGRVVKVLHGGGGVK